MTLFYKICPYKSGADLGGGLRKSNDSRLTLVDAIGLMNIHKIHFNFFYIFCRVTPKHYYII